MPYLFDIKGVMKQLQTKKVRPSDASVCQINLPSHPDRKVVARFDGGRLSSDAGLLCLYALDQQHGLTAGFASCLKDARDSRYVRHQIRELLTQRSFQIVAGYEDCNDADSLRSDPIFKTVCDRLPESDPDLASQPTLSRLENSGGLEGSHSPGTVAAGDLLEAPQEEPAREDHPGHRQHG